MFIKRLAADLVILFSLFFLPGWISLILGLLGFVYFHHYYEGVVMALWFDLLYSLPGPAWFHLPLPVTLMAIVALLIITPVRYRLWY
ncbi:MAG: hypothetical protein Q7T49_00230 [bacterium]|nr:hypothetical protein [bacterium]